MAGVSSSDSHLRGGCSVIKLLPPPTAGNRDPEGHSPRSGAERAGRHGRPLATLGRSERKARGPARPGSLAEGMGLGLGMPQKCHVAFSKAVLRTLGAGVSQQVAGQEVWDLGLWLFF